MKRMQIKPLIAAMITPIGKIIISLLAIAPEEIPLNNSYMLFAPAPAIIGADNKKENRAADSRSDPNARAAVIVLPERDTPGNIASAWQAR